MKHSIMSFAIAAAIGLLPACTMDGYDKPDTDDTKTDDSDFKAEEWGYADRPSGFAGDLIYDITELPLTGVPENRPWAANYYPTYRDNINVQWDGAGSISTAKKYENAFGGSGVEDAVSRYYGIDSRTSAKTCTETSECDSDKGEACAKRTGATEGKCIPTWFGICHAWAPLSTMMPEPKFAVDHNGVNFKVNDIKALMILAHDKTNTKFVSQRCNIHPNDLARDAYGRPTDAQDECRDTNPGTMHVLITNYLGKRGQSFVYDRTYSSEVWNQPIDKYRITMQEAIAPRAANDLLDVKSVGGRDFNANGTVTKDEWFHNESYSVNGGEGFTVRMTGDNDADLYVRFGAQATTSAFDCRPYAGGSAEECALTVPAGVTEAYVSVRGYASSSTFQLVVTAGGGVPDDYFFNSDATKLVHVKMELDYITESRAETDGHFGVDARYIRTDRYEYILELEGDEIVGGEYIGSSKSNHPDFLWLPLSRRATSIAGGAISYANIKALYDKSLIDPNGGGTGGGTGGEGGFDTITDGGTVAKDEWKRYGPFTVEDGAQIRVTLSGDNDADLYVRKGAAPTAQGFDCRPYKSGSDEACTLNGPGDFYVAVRGYATSSSFDIEIEHIGGTGGGTGGGTEPPATVEHLNLQDTVSQSQAKNYTIDVIAGQAITVKTFAANDVDLYIQMGSAPNTSAYLLRAWTTSGNETITYTPSSSGTMHIMVYGYAASDFTLRTEN